MTFSPNKSKRIKTIANLFNMISLTRLNYRKLSHSALYHSVTKAATVICSLYQSFERLQVLALHYIQSQNWKYHSLSPDVYHFWRNPDSLMYDSPLPPSQKHNLRGKLDLDVVSKTRLDSTTVENASEISRLRK